MKKFLIQCSISFVFRQTKETFFVEEIPFAFSQRGGYLIVKVQKSDLTTWQLVDHIAARLRIDKRRIGYAGLKDKHATTIQYLSLPLYLQKEIGKIESKRVRILDTFRHHEPLRIGDLEGNRFKIELSKVEPKGVALMRRAIEEIEKKGMPNYFGYQRFGKDALKMAKAYVNGEYHTKNPRMRKMFTSLYQSDLFNRWLCERVAGSDGEWRLLPGEIYMDNNGRCFGSKKPLYEEFVQRSLTPTGLLPGKRVKRAFLEAGEIERRFDDPFLCVAGSRRAALVYPKDCKMTYQEKRGVVTLAFALPKGSYATVFLENLAEKKRGEICG